jgi:hypothetical protein
MPGAPTQPSTRKKVAPDSWRRTGTTRTHLFTNPSSRRLGPSLTLIVKDNPMTQAQAANASEASAPAAKIIPPELVAKIINGIAQIGRARALLEDEGWTATIVANRITVAGLIVAQLVMPATGTPADSSDPPAPVGETTPMNRWFRCGGYEPASNVRAPAAPHRSCRHR